VISENLNLPLKTAHGNVATGSVGYSIRIHGQRGTVRLVYTSDFVDLPETPPWIYILIADIKLLLANEPLKTGQPIEFPGAWVYQLLKR
jgi:hypothetical protein